MIASLTNDEVVALTLAACNDVRSAYGLEPLDELPPGAPGDPICCPLRKALAPIGHGFIRVQADYVQADRQIAQRLSEIWGTVERSCMSDPKCTCHRHHAYLPDGARIFLRRYDNREFPELIIQPRRLFGPRPRKPATMLSLGLARTDTEESNLELTSV